MQDSELSGAVVIRLHTGKPCGEGQVRSSTATIARRWGVTFAEAQEFAKEWKRINPELADRVDVRFHADEPVFD